MEEFPETNEYNYNASRVPLRIVMDYALYGDTRGKDIANKMVVWIKGKTGNNPNNVKDGYQLNGANRGTYATAVFVAPSSPQRRLQARIKLGSMQDGTG